MQQRMLCDYCVVLEDCLCSCGALAMPRHPGLLACLLGWRLLLNWTAPDGNDMRQYHVDASSIGSHAPRLPGSGLRFIALVPAADHAFKCKGLAHTCSVHTPILCLPCSSGGEPEVSLPPPGDTACVCQGLRLHVLCRLGPALRGTNAASRAVFDSARSAAAVAAARAAAAVSSRARFSPAACADATSASRAASACVGTELRDAQVSSPRVHVSRFQDAHPPNILHPRDEQAMQSDSLATR